MLLVLSILGLLFFAVPALIVVGASRAAADADAWLDRFEESRPPKADVRGEIHPQVRPAVPRRVTAEPQPQAGR